MSKRGGGGGWVSSYLVSSTAVGAPGHREGVTASSARGTGSDGLSNSPLATSASLEFRSAEADPFALLGASTSLDRAVAVGWRWVCWSVILWWRIILWWLILWWRIILWWCIILWRRIILWRLVLGVITRWWDEDTIITITVITAAAAAATGWATLRADLSTLGHKVRGRTGVLDRFTWLGESKVLAVDGVGGAAVADVGLEHVGEVGTLGERGQAALVDGGGGSIALLVSGDSDGSTVHVHLTVTSAVEPSPSKSIFTSGDAVGDLELEVGGAFIIGVVAEVAVEVGWAATNDGVDDLPLGVDGWGLVFGERDLARTTTVRSTTDEAEDLLLTDGIGGWLSWRGRGASAGEVDSGRVKRILLGWAEGRRSLEDHMGISRGDEERGQGNESFDGNHVCDCSVFLYQEDRLIWLFGGSLLNPYRTSI